MSTSQSPSSVPANQPEQETSTFPSGEPTSEPSPSPESAPSTTTTQDKGKGKERDQSESPDSSADSPQSSSSSDTTSPSPDTNTVPTGSGALSAGAWQAIYAPQHGAYYFYNSETGETTWVNPLQQPSTGPSSSTSPDADNSTGHNPNPYDPNTLEARALAAGIDPSLAHLDPSLALPANATPAGTFAAHFNARTGAFTAADARTPQHLSEYERMKRMSEFYFDMNAWEKEVEARHAEEKEGGKKRKRLTKKDLERFKEQKRLKKIAKTAWLRT